jgi:hypothetical protein
VWAIERDEPCGAIQVPYDAADKQSGIYDILAYLWQEYTQFAGNMMDIEKGKMADTWLPLGVQPLKEGSAIKTR